MSPWGINIYIRAWNAYLAWLKEEGHILAPITLKQLKAPLKPVIVLSEADIKLVAAFKPKGFHQLRTWTILCTLLDTGCRINEVLTLTNDNIDFENLLMTVMGKGNKIRKVPFSIEGRKVMFRYRQFANKKGSNGCYFFRVHSGNAIQYRNIYRDIIKLCNSIGITKRVHIHLTRHSFACHWVRAGGSPAALSRILGHCNLTVTNTYLRGLGIEDFHKEHLQFSPLGKAGSLR